MRKVWRLLVKKPEITLDWMINNKKLAIGWGEIGDLKEFRTVEEIADAIRERNKSHPSHKGKHAANATHGSHSLYDFCYSATVGDLVIVSNGKKRCQTWQISGEYDYADFENSPSNQQHHRDACMLDTDPNVVWKEVGASLKYKINYRTFAECQNMI